MKLPPEITAFLAEPVTLILATCGAGFCPDIARGVGVAVRDGVVDVVVSRWQWPGAVANLDANGALALTASDPRSYRTFQLKGRAGLHPAGPADKALAERYRRRMLDLFASLSMAEDFAGKWLSLRDLVVARLWVAECFVQTPGPQAGRRVGP